MSRRLGDPVEQGVRTFPIRPYEFMRLQDDGCPNCPGHLPPREEWRGVTTTYRLTLAFDPATGEVLNCDALRGTDDDTTR